MSLTAFDLAQRFVGTREVPGHASNPAVLAMLQLDTPTITDDAIPWCSAFVNYIAWLARLPRSKSLAARSWLTVGIEVPMVYAAVGSAVVVLKRGTSPWQGHVGFFAGCDPSASTISVLGGNQGDSVSVEAFSRDDVLSVRELDSIIARNTLDNLINS